MDVHSLSAKIYDSDKFFPAASSLTSVIRSSGSNAVTFIPENIRCRIVSYNRELVNGGEEPCNFKAMV
jgi:hypothetical protein